MLVLKDPRAHTIFTYYGRIMCLIKCVIKKVVCAAFKALNKLKMLHLFPKRWLLHVAKKNQLSFRLYQNEIGAIKSVEKLLLLSPREQRYP